MSCHVLVRRSDRHADLATIVPPPGREKTPFTFHVASKPKEVISLNSLSKNGAITRQAGHSASSVRVPSQASLVAAGSSSSRRS